MTSKGAEKMQNDTLGVDISKDNLDAHRLSDGVSRRFANEKKRRWGVRQMACSRVC
jgi:hypothetical protein